MVLEQFCSMLLNGKLFIYTDHKNLTINILNCCCYGSSILYHPGKKNIIANTNSNLIVEMCCQLPISVGENGPFILSDFTSKDLDISSAHEQHYTSSCYSISENLKNSNSLECLPRTKQEQVIVSKQCRCVKRHVMLVF